MEKKQVYEEVREGATIRCRTCGNTERFTIWRPIAEYICLKQMNYDVMIVSQKI